LTTSGSGRVIYFGAGRRRAPGAGLCRVFRFCAVRYFPEGIRREETGTARGDGEGGIRLARCFLFKFKAGQVDDRQLTRYPTKNKSS